MSRASQPAAPKKSTAPGRARNAEHDRSGRYRSWFDSFRPNTDDAISPSVVIEALTNAGLRKTDPRVKAMLAEFDAESDANGLIGFTCFAETARRHDSILNRAVTGDLIIPDFPAFARELGEIFEIVGKVDGGKVAEYIPQLGRVDPELFAVAACTTDGQTVDFGNADVDFSLQSVCKPINYCLALDEHGPDFVHEHIGREPSGHVFNELTLNAAGLPHNPMINSGAIMASSLLRPDLNIADRFDFVRDTWRRLAAGRHIGFNNAVYLSERQTADRNFALAYFMREHRAYPPDANAIEALEFYFQTCSIELDAQSLALAAATLANGGVSPISGERIFSATTVQRCLSLMSSCGLYDYSGEFAFTIGLPAKSGVSGALMVVVPRVLGICVWSPPLDGNGNSVRGVEFCKELVARFNFHAFDNVVDGTDASKVDPRLRKNSATADSGVRLCWAAAQGDLDEVRFLVARGVNVNTADYDGRTALHLAASEGRAAVVRYLLDVGAQTAPVDRWGGTPVADAERAGHADVVALLAESGRGSRAAAKVGAR